MKDNTHPTAASGNFLLAESDPATFFAPELFDEDEQMFGETAQRFVEEQVLPKLDAIEAQESGVLRGLLSECGELGMFGVDVPEEHGGLGATKKAAMLVAEKLGGGGSFGPAAMVQTGIGGLPVVLFGDDQHRAKYLDGIVSGEIATAYGLTETESGTDALAAKATAVLDADKGVYILNGTKQFITNAGFADLFIVFAKVDGEQFTAFLVERGWDGVSVGPEEHKMGLKGSSTCQVILEEVAVPQENVLGEVGKGHRIAFNVLNIGRLKLAPAVLGGKKQSIAGAVQYAAERHQFGKPLTAFGLIRQKIAGAVVRTYCSESMIYRTAGLIDEKIAELKEAGESDSSAATVAALHEFAVECSINKVFGSEALDWVTDEMLQVYGGYGYVSEYPAERHYRDARINRIWEGTNEINRMIITGTLMQRAMKGEIGLLPAIEGLMEALMSRTRFEAPDGLLSEERAVLADMRRMTMLAAGVAGRKFMDKLQNEQEILAWIADMIVQTYAVDSAILRAQRLAESNSKHEARCAVARYALQEAAVVVEDRARLVLAASAEGDELRSMQALLKRLVKRPTFNLVEAGNAIAELAIESGGYPFG